jgi:hypothetical protein
MAMAAGANPVRGPQMAPVGGKDRIALALERGLARSLPEQKPVLLQPAPQRCLLNLALWMGKARNRGNPVLHQRCVSHEDHVGRSWHSWDEPHIGNPLQLPVQLPPLREGHIAAGPMQVSRHPGIDNVIHVIPLR